MTIHFRDNYGYGALEVDKQNVSDVLENLRNDPEVDDIWFDDEEDYE